MVSLAEALTESALAVMAREFDDSALARVLNDGIPAARAPDLRLRLEAAGGRILGFGGGELPWRLGLCDVNPAPLLTTDAPDDAFDDRPSVAIVGTRKATAGGLEIARALGMFLADAGIVVVSGLARGIDGAAHRGIVAAGGCGVAVLGSGLDVVYPRQHRSLADDLRASGGGLVSQFAPGAPPLPYRFPRRNQVISALADAVVVVEAHATGGALITARIALDMGRTVLCVPGSPLSPASAGTNRLIADGAGVVAEFSDVLDALSLSRPAGRAPVPTAPLVRAPDAASARVLELLSAEPVSLDRLVRLLRCDAPVVSQAVSRLELHGLAVRERGGVRLKGRFA